ncbi:hypothetical protein FKW77_006820 [Venturia effusa]|uniref:Uncharacterized protein n=1 Tax=Venturia effusa TaxID=50376 RepID=A0A517LFQ8_9PEZI|nr:hypothetical protein FKW77_006820 [Venturia effusa]
MVVLTRSHKRLGLTGTTSSTAIPPLQETHHSQKQYSRNAKKRALDEEDEDYAYDGPSIKRRPGIAVSVAISNSSTGQDDIERNDQAGRASTCGPEKISTGVRRRRACEICKLQDKPCEHKNELTMLRAHLPQPSQGRQAPNRKKRKQQGSGDVHSERPSKQLKTNQSPEQAQGHQREPGTAELVRDTKKARSKIRGSENDRADVDDVERTNRGSDGEERDGRSAKAERRTATEEGLEEVLYGRVLETNNKVEKLRGARLARGKHGATRQQTNDQEQQGSPLSSKTRQLEEMRASQKKLEMEITALKKTNEKQQELLRSREAEILALKAAGEQDNEVNRLNKVIQDQKHKLDTQGPIVRQWKIDGAKARAEVSREVALDKDMAFKLQAMVLNLNYISRTSAVDNLGENSLRDRFGGREAITDILREEAWISLETHELKGEMMIQLLVESWMNRWICEDVLLKPFSFMVGLENPEEQAVHVSIEKALLVLADGYGKNSLRVNTARSDLVKLFNPNDEVSHAGIERLQATVNAARTTADERSAARFLYRFKDLLKESSKTKDNLLKIMRDVNVLATEFAAQKSYVRCYGIQDLPETFSNDSQLMAPHGWHGDPKKMDGKRVLLVVQPAIVAMGRASGRDYGLPPRIIKKAIVWLG